MKRDTLKTLAGLAIIALIVVATFVYGNAQRQAQNKHDQALKPASASVSPVAAAKASASPKPKASSAPTNSSVATGPVDGAHGSATTTTPSAKPATTPASTTAPVSAPVTGGSAMPATGPASALPLLGATAIGFAYLSYRRSRRNVLAAQRTSRP